MDRSIGLARNHREREREREREGRRKRRNELMGRRAEDDDEKKEVNLGIGSEGPRCDAL